MNEVVVVAHKLYYAKLHPMMASLIINGDWVIEFKVDLVEVLL